jgi:hypothetical protein
MAFGTLKADTLTHSTAGSVTTDNVVEGSAKAWAHIAAGGASLPDSFNFSSIDDDGTGQYGLNYTNNMGSAFYSANMNITFNHSSSVNNVRVPEIEFKSTSSVEVDSAYVNSSGVWVQYDIESNASVTVQGNLA